MQEVQNGKAAARRSRHSAAQGSVSGKIRRAGGRLLARLCRSDEGQSLVEMAYIIPIFLAVIMGMFSIGLGMIVYEQLGEAAYEGAVAIVQNQGVDDSGTSTQTDLCLKAYNAVQAVLTGGPNWSSTNLANITYSATLYNGTTATAIPSSNGSFSCSSQSIAGDLGPKSQVTFTLKYTYTWLPILNPVTHTAISLGTANMQTQQSLLAY
jgi:Flp pilus assembly protein TadG